jgi:Ca2+-binding RTX toxin-like protein
MAVIYPREAGLFIFSNGTAADDIVLAGSGATIMSGRGGHDFFLGSDGRDDINGGTSGIFFNDVFDTEGDVVHAGGGNDSIRGSSDRDYLFGEDGDDRILGFGGDDVIFAGDGDDVLLGLEGGDFLDGGAGADTFQFGNSIVNPQPIGNDTLGWFEQGIDKLDLRALGVTDTKTVAEALVSSRVGLEPSEASFLELTFSVDRIHIPGIEELTNADFVV